ncbi:MAG: serine hydrolase domain-containing protein [Pyrinomonadaceae bacterium]
MKDRFLHGLLSLVVISAFAVSGLAPAVRSQTAVREASVDISAALERIEQKVEARRSELNIPGMSLAIVKDGRVVYSKGLGFKDLENKRPVTPDTQFAIGSATKAFTALTVLLAQDEGKLSLDDSPKKLLPYFKMYDPETDSKITIRDLLSHSSGLNRTDLAMITGRLDRNELIQVAAQAKPTAKLREKFQYQNLMFTAAGEIAAVAEKKAWEKLVPERIFRPLGMRNSTMSIAQMQKTKDRSFGYSYNFDTKETQKLPYREIAEVAPAGSINSSAADMAKWITFILEGGSVNGKRLVSEKGFSEWLKPQMKITPDGKMSYGLGWFLQEWNGLKVAQHGGNIDGFNSMVAMIPEKKIGFVMLTNVSASSLGSELMPIVWQELLPESVPKASTKLSLDEMNKLVGKYRLEAAKIDIEVKADNGDLVMVVPGQPQYILSKTASRNFKMLGAPDGFAVRFDPDQGAAASMYLQQPQGNYTLPRINADGTFSKTGGDGTGLDKGEPPISVDELSKKVVEAAGGEANWRKLVSRVATFESDFENQGVQATGTVYSKAPNKTATDTTMTALGKKIALVWEFFDGEGGEESYTFGPVDKFTGKRLDDIKVGADFYGPLDWESKYKKIEVAKIAKVGGEEAYVVNFEPVQGSKFTEYYSTKSFLLLKREGIIPSSTGGPSLPYAVTYSDYRDVDGVKLAFRSVSYSPSNGNIVTRMLTIRHNMPIDDGLFKPRILKL